jgi:hypothetical protein
MSSLLLLDEKEKLIALGRRTELFCPAQKNYEKNTCGISVKKICKKWGSNSRQFQDRSIKPLFTV